MSTHFDIAVIGSGFAGSLMAMVCRRLGYSVLLLEKGQHPRVVIGESSTPLSNLLLEQLADAYDLPRLKPLTKWGTWQHVYPEIGCGLKRGFTFLHHTLGSHQQPHPDRQLLVAASPQDRIADTHWFRADFDQFLMQEARALDACYVDELHLAPATQDGGTWVLRGMRLGQPHHYTADLLIDASGPGGFLHRSLGLASKPFPHLPATSALYTHLRNVAGIAPDLPSPDAPYPPDEAAVHHLFDGGWIWVLRFNNGLTSAGIAATAAAAERFRLHEGAPAWQRVLEALPAVQRQFAHAEAATPFTYAPQLAFRSTPAAGAGWALLPSAAGFVDPLLSTGFPLTLLGVRRLARILAERQASASQTEALAVYAEQTDAELDATANLIGALYRHMANPRLFRALSLLYFAAASYAETAHRLGKPERAPSFLLHSDPLFGPSSQQLLHRAQCALSLAEEQELEQDIYTLIERYDVAGLGKRPATHCYPVDAADLFASAHKLDASAAEIEAMLARAGFTA